MKVLSTNFTLNARVVVRCKSSAYHLAYGVGHLMTNIYRRFAYGRATLHLVTRFTGHVIR
nr:hypothetical protein [Chicken picobirnavirus]